MIGYLTQYYLSERLLRYYDTLSLQQHLGSFPIFPEWLLLRIHEARKIAN